MFPLQWEHFLDNLQCYDDICNAHCKYHHNTVLHEFNNIKFNFHKESILDKNIYSNVSKNKGNRTVSPLVAVKLRASDNSWVTTYAALDAWSSRTFIDKCLVNKLGYNNGSSCKFLLSTMNGVSQEVESKCFVDVEIKSFNGNLHRINVMYQIDNWPFSGDNISYADVVRKFSHLHNLEFDFPRANVGILIGMDCPELIKVLGVVGGEEGEPFAVKYSLGWTLNGSVCGTDNFEYCHRVSRIDQIESNITKLFAKDFDDPNPIDKADSVADTIWRRKVDDSMVHGPDGKLQICLPFKDDKVSMPNNEAQARSALRSLKRKFVSNLELQNDYTNFVENMINKSYLVKIPDDEIHTENGKCWYLVHHSVYHKVKKRIRVVFDCSRKCAGVSLNDKLIGGPDLMNSLVGVLLRFRESFFAVKGDIEQMFMQIRVPREHSDYMRVLWWPQGDVEKEPQYYRLMSHTFGAVSSPSIANYAVKQSVSMGNDNIDPETEFTINSCAYVDDIMRSFDTEDEALKYLTRLSTL